MVFATGAWKESVSPHFDFLLDHGFRADAVAERSAWETSLLYRSSHAAIRVSLSREFDRVEVNLIRLVEGDVPPYPIWVTDADIHWVLLDTVVEARHRELGDARGGLDAEAVERQLAFWATTLQTVASDFVSGDLGAIDEAGALLRERVRQHPQQLTTWIPEDAPRSADEDATRRIAATVPPEVGVVTRRYRRWRRRRVEDP